MARKLPQNASWAQREVDRAVEVWEQNGKLYYIAKNAPDSKYPISLRFVDLVGQGGGSSPFENRQELDEYVRRLGLRPEQQLTLGL